MSPLAAVGFVVFILILFISIYLALLGLPGTVLIFADVLAYATVTGFYRIGFKIILFLLLFSIIAETLDFLMGVAGALNPVPSKELFWASAIGGITGSFIFTPLFLGLGTFGGFILGCFTGILIAEFIRQSKLQSPFKASYRSIFTMIGGKMIKGFISLSMIALSLANIYS